MLVHTFLPVLIAMVFAFVVGGIFACGLSHGRDSHERARERSESSRRIFVVVTFEDS